MIRDLALIFVVVPLGVCCALWGCGGPNKASIIVRKENQDLHDKVDELKRQHEADEAKIRGLEARVGTVTTLPEDRLDKMFTAHGFRFNTRLTGGADLDLNKPGDEGIKIYVVPTDQAGDPIKTSGTFKVELFDLADNGAKVGEWDFDHEKSAKSWNGNRLIYAYVLECPWQSVPKHRALTARVSFTDDLTQRIFVEQQKLTVELPPAATTAATTAPASQ
jgi:hypothetical protein